jgi:tetrapyrrole methylase family protein/MazG family protein
VPGRPRIVVVGLGPGDPALLSLAARAAIDRVPRRFVRTARHPSAVAVAGAEAFDAVYHSAATLDEVYPAIVDALVAAASADGEVLYAVPGSPLVAERTVELLRADRRVTVELVLALSFVDLAWARLGVDPLAAGARLVDGHRFAAEAAGERGPLLVAQCDSRLVLSDIKLALEGPGPEVTVLQRLGLPDEAAFPVAWADLDRSFEPDHLTCLWVPTLAAPVGRELVRLAELVRTLRERCPWDRGQTHRSLTRHLLEETYEVIEAIDGLGPDGNRSEHLEEELGDLLFQVYFHATIAAEEGWFDLADVARGIHDKLVRRHPHVFAGGDAVTADAVAANWETIKRDEKGRTEVMEGIPDHLPSLLYAHKVQSRAASAGMDWSDVDGAWPKIAEETAELRAVLDHGGGPAEVAGELGDLLFAVVNVARHLDVDPEAALRAAAVKFRRRFEAVERLARQRGDEPAGLGLEALDRLWDEVKALEAAGPHGGA